MRGWLRHLSGREPDLWTLLLAVDAMPPVTFDLGVAGWAPTLELTAHLRARPAPGWLRLRTWTDNYAGGLFEENAERSEEHTSALQSRQYLVCRLLLDKQT